MLFRLLQQYTSARFHGYQSSSNWLCVEMLKNGSLQNGEIWGAGNLPMHKSIASLHFAKPVFWPFCPVF